MNLTMNMTKDDIGKWVEYRDRGEPEKGRIKSFNGNWVFVVFKCDGNWDSFQNYTACACNCGHLTFIEPLDQTDPLTLESDGKK